MKIVFDIDGVITDILKFQREEGTKYFNKKGIKISNIDGFTIEEMYNVSKEEAYKFWRHNTLKYCLMYPARKDMVDLIKKLNDNGDNVYCVTKRMLADHDDIIGVLMRSAIKLWFKLQNIKISSKNIIFTDTKEDPYKEIAIKGLHADVIIEDDEENAKVLNKCTNVILVCEEHNKNVKGRNIKKTHTISEIEKVIDRIRIKKTTYNAKLIKSHTGYASIDKPYKAVIDERPFIDNNISMYDFYKTNNKYTGNLKSIEYFNKRVSFDELNKRIDYAAKALLEMGIKKGNKVACIMPNQPETVIYFFAANKIGAEWITFNPKEFISPSPAFIKTFNSIKAKVAVVTEVYAEGYYKVKDELNIKKTIVVKPNITMNEPLKHGYDIAQIMLKSAKKHKFNKITTKIREHRNKLYLNKMMKDDNEEIKIPKTDFDRKLLHIEKVLRNTSLFKVKYDENNISWNEFEKIGKNSKLELKSVGTGDDYAIGICTGGTTGVPKIVRHTNKALNFTQIISGNVTTNYHTGDVWYAILPNFHIFGFVNALFVPLASGMGICQIPKPDLNTIGKEITKYKPEHIALVPAAMEAMFEYFKQHKKLSYVLKNIKTISCGGGALTLDKESEYNRMLEEAGSKAKISNGFGMTETCSAIIYPNDKDRTVGTIGMPVYGTDVKIIDRETNKELKYDEIGEIYVSGPTVLTEYFNNKRETNKVLITDENDKVWLNTKDLGTINKKGQITFIGRTKNLIEKNGEKIYPEVIDNILKTNKLVKFVATVGPKNKKGKQDVFTYVVLNDDASLSDEVKDLLNHTLIQNGLKLSIPDHYEQLDMEDIPYTKIAKIDIMELTRRAEDYIKKG